MMAMMTRRIASASAIAFLVTASMVTAQTPASVRVRATIASVDSGILTAKARDGGEMKIKLADNAPVNEVVRAPLSDHKGRLVPGHNRFAAARRQPEGNGDPHLPTGRAPARRLLELGLAQQHNDQCHCG